MTDDVRAAAERLARYIAGRAEVLEQLEHLGRMPPGLRLSIEDTAAVANAYLAEHPADDGEPVTADWLQSVGFGRHMQPAANCDLSLQAGDFRLFVAVAIPTRERYGFKPERWAVNEVWLPEAATPATRGHVRRLCAALGIPLTETPK